MGINKVEIIDTILISLRIFELGQFLLIIYQYKLTSPHNNGTT